MVVSKSRIRHHASAVTVSAHPYWLTPRQYRANRIEASDGIVGSNMQSQSAMRVEAPVRHAAARAWTDDARSA